MRNVARLMAIVCVTLVACGSDPEPAATGTTASTLSTTSTTAVSAATTAVSAATTARPGATTTRAGSVTSTTAATLSCKTIGFTPNSEDAASDIRATGLSCDEAEAFVRIAGMLTSSGGPPEVDVEGFHCVRTRSQEEPLPASFYECTNGPKKVTFTRS